MRRLVRFGMVMLLSMTLLLAGCATVIQSGGIAVPPEQTGIGVTPGTPPAGEDAGTDSNLVITQASAGKTIHMKVGERVLVQLGSDFDWEITVDPPTVVSRVRNITVIRGAQGIYQADQAGQATLTAIGTPTCASATPPCMAPSLQVVVTIDVTNP